MSDERQAFEQLHAIPSGAIWCENRDVYIHKNYSGIVLHPINESWEAFCEGALWQARRAGQAVSVPQQWRDTMEELAADLESEIENRRTIDLNRRIERDLVVVREARALLAEQEQGQ